MKTGIISDLHGNAVALETVLEDIKKAGAKELLIAGDFVGYYYRPNEIFTLLHSWSWDGILGNHDVALRALSSGKGNHMLAYRAKYGSGLDLALERLSSKGRDLLFSLPQQKEIIRSGKKILLCHGSPFDAEAYVYPDAGEALFAKIASLGYDFVVMGHTHYPLVKRLTHCTIINPGSVGQPRDEGSMASWALVDFESGETELHRTRFSPNEMIQEARLNDPRVPYLQDILQRKRSSYAA